VSSTACPEIRLAGIVNDSITDGPGLRFVLFTQGCLHHCPGCHNPQTWDVEGGQGDTAAAIYEQIRANPLLDGVTFSGGEPFLQAEALLPLARMIRAGGYELAIYSGYTLEELLQLPDPAVGELLKQANILIDGPYVQAERSLSLSFRGSKNQRILDVPASLTKGAAVLSRDPDWTGEW